LRASEEANYPLRLVGVLRYLSELEDLSFRKLAKLLFVELGQGELSMSVEEIEHPTDVVLWLPLSLHRRRDKQ